MFYQFKEKIDYLGHFWFLNSLIDQKFWAELPLASRAIYPTIAIHFNKHGQCFPSERTIAIMSGISEKTAGIGRRNLEKFPVLKMSRAISARGFPSYKYEHVGHESQDGSFPFFKSVIEGGNWSEISNTAKALYIVMRRFGHFDEEVYWLHEELEEDSFYDENIREIYSQRLWDFCNTPIEILAEFAGICYRSTLTALVDLEKNYLIESHSDESWDGWKVLLEPRRVYKRKYLNQKITKSYRHLKNQSRKKLPTNNVFNKEINKERTTEQKAKMFC